MEYNNRAAKWVFSSGRTISANADVFGLGPALNLREGYDGLPDLDGNHAIGEPSLTATERRELADMMIARWQKWAAEGEFPPRKE